MRSNRVIPLASMTEDEYNLRKNRERESNVNTLEYMAATGMMARYLSRGFKALNIGISRFVFFPLILLFQTIDLGLAVNQARLEAKIQGKPRTATLIKLVTEALTFGATATAIIGGMFAPALFLTVITPALLVAGVGLKAFVDFGTAAFLFARSLKKPNTELEVKEQAADRYNAGRKLLSGIVNSCITVALALIAFTPAVPLVASLFLGVGGAVTGVALAAMSKERRARVNTIENQDSAPQSIVSEQPENALSSTAALQQKLQVVYGLPKPDAALVVAASTSAAPLSSRPAHLYRLQEAPSNDIQPLLDTHSSSRLGM